MSVLTTQISFLKFTESVKACEVYVVQSLSSGWQHCLEAQDKRCLCARYNRTFKACLKWTL